VFSFCSPLVLHEEDFRNATNPEVVEKRLKFLFGNIEVFAKISELHVQKKNVDFNRWLNIVSPFIRDPFASLKEVFPKYAFLCGQIFLFRGAASEVDVAPTFRDFLRNVSPEFSVETHEVQDLEFLVGVQKAAAQQPPISNEDFATRPTFTLVLLVFPDEQSIDSVSKEELDNIVDECIDLPLFFVGINLDKNISVKFKNKEALNFTWVSSREKFNRFRWKKVPRFVSHWVSSFSVFIAPAESAGSTDYWKLWKLRALCAETESTELARLMGVLGEDHLSLVSYESISTEEIKFLFQKLDAHESASVSRLEPMEHVRNLMTQIPALDVKRHGAWRR
jgi:hypothetical protein